MTLFPKRNMKGSLTQEGNISLKLLGISSFSKRRSFATSVHKPGPIPSLEASHLSLAQHRGHVSYVAEQLKTHGVLKINLGFPDGSSRYLQQLCLSLHENCGHQLPITHSGTRGWFVSSAEGLYYPRSRGWWPVQADLELHILVGYPPEYHDNNDHYYPPDLESTRPFRDDGPIPMAHGLQLRGAAHEVFCPAGGATRPMRRRGLVDTRRRQAGKAAVTGDKGRANAPRIPGDNPSRVHQDARATSARRQSCGTRRTRRLGHGDAVQGGYPDTAERRGGQGPE